ncbi:Hydroxyacid oxidase 1 [Armadillidium nasatum]|uniref:Hydroxyacid oxidase 1 n=1 Tax=Armadillidium nasatum TaxID=96803 RepID=A0A5N5SJ14_9CRUS|nr:Hydroxyacid oxidase 1 [Armadillidium nasatum]
MQGMCHPDGESGAARATTDLETVSKENVLKFFQLYVYSDKNLTTQLVRRAEKAGYKALVVTIDLPAIGIRYNDHRNKFTLPSHLRMANFDEIEFPEEVTKSKGGFLEYLASYFSSSLTWEDIEWLKSITTLPIVLKGILTAEDAIKGLEMEALPEIVDAVGHACEIYVDGGVRTGADIFKALALGANMVFVGRPMVWGLTCGGYDGAYKVLQILEHELKNTMCLSGCPTVKSITRDRVVRKMFSKL